MSGPYVVGVGRNWYKSTGNPAPDRTCGHQHRTAQTAFACGRKLYGSRYVRGSWTACAAWHCYYIMDGSGAMVSL